MTISDKGLDLIKREEAFRADPYLCPAGIPTIGYGTTHYPDGRSVTMHDKPVTKYFATLMLKYEVSHTYSKTVNHYVRIALNQNQFDALVSFVYNVGVSAFKKSTLLKALNNDEIIKAENEFHKWSHVNGKVSKGLLARRDKEKALFMAAMA